jgi:hypothetical protein
VLLEECEALRAANQSVDHHDVCLPHGWHLNRARVPVPPPPPAGPKMDAEIRRSIRNLPEALRLERKYRNRQLWLPGSTPRAAAAPATTITSRGSRMTSSSPPPPLPGEEDEDYHVVKEEADVAMEDAAPPPGAGDLPPEYQAVVVGGYDEEALLQLVLEASKVDEDTPFSDLQEVLSLTGMVAQHMALLPPPSPLSPHAPLLVAYEGQEMPPPLGVSCREHRHDHPQGIVINPPPQP